MTGAGLMWLCDVPGKQPIHLHPWWTAWDSCQLPQGGDLNHDLCICFALADYFQYRNNPRGKIFHSLTKFAPYSCLCVRSIFIHSFWLEMLLFSQLAVIPYELGPLAGCKGLCVLTFFTVTSSTLAKTEIFIGNIFSYIEPLFVVMKYHFGWELFVSTRRIFISLGNSTFWFVVFRDVGM